MLSTWPANSAAGENGIGGLVWYLPAIISVSKKLSAALDAYHGLARAGLGVGNIGNFQIVGRAITRTKQAFMAGYRYFPRLSYRVAVKGRLHIADIHP